MPRWSPLVALFLLCAPALAETEGTGPDVTTLPAKTCTALDAVGVALSDNPDDPTSPVSGAAVWGCYFGAFTSFSAAPIAPGAVTACATAGGGIIGALMEGRPILPLFLWTAPGVAVGLLFSVVGLAIAIGAAAAYVSFGALMTGPVIALISAAIFVFSAASLISGPLTLAGVIYAEELSRMAPAEEKAPPPPTALGALLY